MMIETAMDSLAQEDALTVKDMAKELEMAEYLRSQDVNFRDGYLLGVKTCEVMLLMRGQKL